MEEPHATVQCDVCDVSYHVTCVGFAPDEDLSSLHFECPLCVAAKCVTVYFPKCRPC